MYFVDSTGQKIVEKLYYSKEVFLLVYLTLRAALFHRVQGIRTVFGVICAQIYFTGVQALPLVSMLAIFAGSIVVMQSVSQFSLLGASNNFLGEVMVVVAIREVGPLLTALIVIARSGTAVASELGNQKVNREIEALEVMGINPLTYIVFPRLMGGVVSVFCLSFYFVFMSFLGGYMVAALANNMPFDYYVSSLAKAVAKADVIMFLMKNVFGGIIIFAISCWQGLSVSEGPHQVPQATTKAVMNSIAYVLVFNLSLTVVYYLHHLSRLGIL
jgi:phospholipid/cholesterol/gamma-HCH transport system permease protein